jgi:mycofactocin precursor
MQDTIPTTDASDEDADAVDPSLTMPSADDDLLVDADLVVEDISIDGMCGVY